MFTLLKNWYQRNFSDPSAIALTSILLFTILVMYFTMAIIAPLLIAIILAYLLEIQISFLQKHLKFNRLCAVLLIFTIFVFALVFIFVVIVPALVSQVITLSTNLPQLLNSFSIKLKEFQSDYPVLLDTDAVEMIKNNLIELGNGLLPYLFSSLMSVFSLCVYAFIVPLMTFFIVKEKQNIIDNLKRFLPKENRLVAKLSLIMQAKIRNYIAGKVIEFFIMTFIVYFEFLYFRLDYALLLAIIVGLSVFIPYIGVLFASVPVIIISFSQFGLGSTLNYLLIIFAIIQIIDGNLIVPFLFSEAVNLSPLTIIVSVIIFGGIWGVWGVFFAIPLASLIKAIIEIWPKPESTLLIEPTEITPSDKK